MDKQILKIILTFILFSFLTSSTSACPALKKLGRGVINVATSPLEVPKQTFIEFNRGRKITFHVSVWILSGLAKGTAYSIGRLASGVWDIVSFPIPKPADYKPLMQPPTVFEQ